MSYYGEGRYSHIMGRLLEGCQRCMVDEQMSFSDTQKLGRLCLKWAGLCVFLLSWNPHMHTDERRLRWIVGGIGMPWVWVGVAQKWINDGKKWGENGMWRFRSDFPEWLALSGICREAKRHVQAQAMDSIPSACFPYRCISNKPH